MATLGQQTIGSIVKLNVNGVATNFIVVHQGLPGTMYDSSCNGTWLLMQDAYAQMAFDATDNSYANSDVHSYLNGTFLNLLDSNIKNSVKQAKIPYTNGTGYSGAVATGASGLSTKVFVLSVAEINYAQTYTNTEGSVLAYFQNLSSSGYYAYLNGSIKTWWLRSPVSKGSNVTTSQKEIQVSVSHNSNGEYGRNSCTLNGNVVRPALILPNTLLVSGSGSVYINSPPTTPGTPSVPNEASAGDAITVSWSASTDADGNLSGYELYVSVNGGTWTQIYIGSSRSYAYTVPEGVETLSFRVRAYDSASAYSAYATSATVAVSSGAITGTVPINGVQRELTGKGYINIGGVLHELSDSSVNIGGTLKSLKG